jgi:hypothetical protein
VLASRDVLDLEAAIVLHHGIPNRFRPSLTVAFKELHRTLVPFRSLARVERAQIPALAGLRIDLSRI